MGVISDQNNELDCGILANVDKLADSESENLLARSRQFSRVLTNLYNAVMPIATIRNSYGLEKSIPVKVTQLVVLEALYDTSWWEENRNNRLSRAHESKRSRLRTYYASIPDKVVQVDLAAHLNLDCTTICRNLKALIESGWVESSRGILSQREVMVGLTESGRQIVEEARIVKRRVTDILNESLGDELWHRIVDDLDILSKKALYINNVIELVNEECEAFACELASKFQKVIKNFNSRVDELINEAGYSEESAKWLKCCNLEIQSGIINSVLCGNDRIFFSENYIPMAKATYMERNSLKESLSNIICNTSRINRIINANLADEESRCCNELECARLAIRCHISQIVDGELGDMVLKELTANFIAILGNNDHIGKYLDKAVAESFKDIVEQTALKFATIA